MCDFCNEILSSNVKKHEIHQCPLKKGSYCCFCSSFGHNPRSCNKDLTFREPQTLEQLIPVSILEEYGIHTNTKIESTKQNISLPKPKRIIDYIDDSKAIRSLLKAYGNMPKKDDRSKEKYKNHLEKIAKKQSIVLVRHEPEKKDGILDGRTDDSKSESTESTYEPRKSGAKRAK